MSWGSYPFVHCHWKTFIFRFCRTVYGVSDTTYAEQLNRFLVLDGSMISVDFWNVRNKLERELPDHPECREPDTLRKPLVVDAEDLEDEEYSMIGVNLDPGEDPAEEPVEEQK